MRACDDGESAVMRPTHAQASAHLPHALRGCTRGFVRTSARVRGPGPGGKDQLRERRHLLTSVILSPHNLEEKEKNEKGTHCGPREETSPLQHTRAAPRVGKSHGRPRRFGKALLTPLLSGPAPSGGEISSWVAERPADVTPGSTRAGGPQ